MSKVKIKTIGKYNGHSFKPNGAVELKFKFSYDELINYYYKLPLLRSVDIKIATKVEDKESKDLGTFNLKSFRMDLDGEGQTTFNSQYSFVESKNLNELVEDKNALIKILMKAEVEDENEQDDE